MSTPNSIDTHLFGPLPIAPISHNERLVKSKTTPLAKHMPTENKPIEIHHGLNIEIKSTNPEIIYITEEYKESINRIEIFKSDLLSALEKIGIIPAKKSRKVIQMAHRESGDWICLCDDGSLWEIVGREWFKLSNVPQD